MCSHYTSGRKVRVPLESLRESAVTVDWWWCDAEKLKALTDSLFSRIQDIILQEGSLNTIYIQLTRVF